jgi:hypothetical protein
MMNDEMLQKFFYITIVGKLECNQMISFRNEVIEVVAVQASQHHKHRFRPNKQDIAQPNTHKGIL